MATPMSARLSAGASLTPSPVIETTCPFFWSVSTRRTLSSGATRATTPISSTCWLELLVAQLRLELRAEHRPALDPELRSPIAPAVVTWSPVIMRARIPASLQRAIASLASLRGGSTMATSASKVRPWTSVEMLAAGC